MPVLEGLLDATSSDTKLTPKNQIIIINVIVYNSVIVYNCMKNDVRMSFNSTFAFISFWFLFFVFGSCS